MSSLVFCEFKHVLSKKDGEQIASNIKTFVQPKRFDESGIKNCGKGGNDTIRFQLTRDEVNRLRDNLSKVLPTEVSSVWFSILSDPLDSLIPLTLITTQANQSQGSVFDVSCQFGSLRSYNQFYSHVQFNNRVVRVSFKPERQIPSSIQIEFDNIRITIPIKSIQKQNILVNKENSKHGVYVLLSLKYLPNMFRMEQVNAGSKNKQTFEKQFRLCGNESNIPFIREIVHCSDVIFHFPPSENIPWLFLSHFLIERPEQYRFNFSCFKISDWSRENNNNFRPDPFDYRRASFQDRYCLQMLTSLGYVFRDKWAQLTDQELKWNQLDAIERYSFCCFVVEKLKEDHAYDLTQATNDYIERKKKTKSTSEMNENDILVDNSLRLKVPCCTLTPMRIIFQPLEETTGSRALRNSEFGGAERFLLVHFREEDNRQLRVTNIKIKDRLKHAMQNGIKLFDNQYVYLGASTGQMKEMAFWFIDLPSNINNIKEAYAKLGDFDGIRNIATYIARVGQFFSTTWPVNINLTKVNNINEILSNGVAKYVLEIPDIERNGYCFTDGVGKISWGLAGRVAQRMNIPIFCQEDIPSAFQIRVAGCKGMVAIDPESNLNDYYIHVRKSMIKFPSDDWNLEICEFARPLTLTLNNQVIRLLSDLGNSDEQFLAFQNQGFTQWHVPEEQQPTAIDIAVQKNASYSLSKENLITNRIPIPPTDGRNLFGVADETDELKYGECFIQYSVLNQTKNTGQRKFHVLTGTVLVTKNPCLWPGDFRRLTAVPNRKLESCMRDVIVFPTKGSRPHPNEIAGSDLDGDQYWVYWGDRLKIEKEAPQLAYTGAKKLEVPSITAETIINHIINSFSAGIILGMISNTHTVVADKHPEHSFSQPCKELAEMFSIAVDSPKTGHFIDKGDIRKYQSEYCRDWPAYMRKFGERTCLSNSVLEQLFKRAEQKYYEWKQSPFINKFPQQMRAIKGTSTNDIKDENFNVWINGVIYEEDANQAKPSGKKASKSNNKTTIASTMISETTEKQEEKPKRMTKKSSQDISNRPETSSTQKKTSNNESASKNEAPFATNDQCYINFLMAINARVTVASAIQCNRLDKNYYRVDFNKEITERVDNQDIINKIVALLAQQDVFKRKPSVYNQGNHGTLYLIVFYGHINFNLQDPLPAKLGQLNDMIKEKGDQCISLNHININELNMPQAMLSRASMPKNSKLGYELDCCVSSSSSSSPSEYFTLIFDDGKNLRQIRVYRVWSKCFVRQPNCKTDSLYEVRSIITHDSGSENFTEILNLIFKNAQSTKLLSGRKPNITMDHKILSSSVTPINLKIIEDQIADSDCQGIDNFYQKVRYVSADERQEKSDVTSTMEYHVSPINKNQEILERVCTSAFSLTTRT